MDNKEKYIERLKTKLDEWNEEINRLEAKAKKAEAGARERYEKELQNLRAYYSEARQKYLNIQKATKDTWETLRQEAEEASGKIREAINRYNSDNKQ